MSIVCLGESLVDLIRRPAGPDAAEPSAEVFDTYFGGALANAAVAIARAGGSAALAGGCGGDEFGRFLRGRLLEEDVDCSLLLTPPGMRTPFAFVRFDPSGEPDFAIHGSGIEQGVTAHAGREERIIEAADGLLIGSNTLVDDGGRAVTERLVELASDSSVDVLFDPNLRLHRWPATEAAVDACRALIPRCRVVKSNIAEARLLVGESGAEAAAAAQGLVELGAGIGVVTSGAAGAVARGEACGEAAAPPVADPLPLGAGDAFMGTLAAVLTGAGFSPGAMEDALDRSCAAAAAACSRMGAID